MPLILHTHSTTGMAYMTLTKAIESGIDVIDCRDFLLLRRYFAAVYRNHVLCLPAVRH